MQCFSRLAEHLHMWKHVDFVLTIPFTSSSRREGGLRLFSNLGILQSGGFSSPGSAMV